MEIKAKVGWPRNILLTLDWTGGYYKNRLQIMTFCLLSVMGIPEKVKFQCNSLLVAETNYEEYQREISLIS